MARNRSGPSCLLSSLVLASLFACGAASAQNWSLPQLLNPSQGLGTSSNTDLAAAPGGRFVSVWASNGVGSGADWDHFHATSSDGGATWSGVGPLNMDAASDSRTDMVPRIVAGPNGTFVTIWPVFARQDPSMTCGRRAARMAARLEALPSC